VSPSGTTVAPTVREALAWATGEIARVSDTARLDAELLLAHALGRSREELVMGADASLDEVDGSGGGRGGGGAERFGAYVRRRVLAREAVAYIISVRHFRRLALAVDPRALIPRPESELLVEVALGLPRGAAVLDLGTGSGALALAIKDERPDLEVAGSDVSPDALALAAENGNRLGLEVEWIHADLLVGVPDRFDAIVCNPPYVAEPERERLAPEITGHEPDGALFGGEDGMEVIRAILAQVAPRARRRARVSTRMPGTGQAGESPAQGGRSGRPAQGGRPVSPGTGVGRLALEVGAGQAGVVLGLVREAGFGAARTLRDLAGIERVVVGDA
jgi:release factor glutamine methyltransferase